MTIGTSLNLKPLKTCKKLNLRSLVILMSLIPIWVFFYESKLGQGGFKQNINFKQKLFFSKLSFLELKYYLDIFIAI